MAVGVPDPDTDHDRVPVGDRDCVPDGLAEKALRDRVGVLVGEGECRLALNVGVGVGRSDRVSVPDSVGVGDPGEGVGVGRPLRLTVWVNEGVRRSLMERVDVRVGEGVVLAVTVGDCRLGVKGWVGVVV